MIDINTALIRYFESLEKYFDDQKKCPAPKTPQGVFENNGIRLGKQDLVVLAGHSCMGKLDFGINYSLRSSINSGDNVLMFSTKQSSKNIVERMIAAKSLIDRNRFMRDVFDDEEWKRICEASEAIKQSSIKIDDCGTASDIEFIFLKCKIEYENNGLDLVFVDSIDFNHQGLIIKDLKTMAQTFDVPVVTTMNLRPLYENNVRVRKPTLQDLTEQNKYVQMYSNVIALMYRDEYYNNREDNPCRAMVDFNVVQNNNGPCVRFGTKYNHKCALFAEELGDFDEEEF